MRQLTASRLLLAARRNSCKLPIATPMKRVDLWRTASVVLVLFALAWIIGHQSRSRRDQHVSSAPTNQPLVAPFASSSSVPGDNVGEVRSPATNKPSLVAAADASVPVAEMPKRSGPKIWPDDFKPTHTIVIPDPVHPKSGLMEHIINPGDELEFLLDHTWVFCVQEPSLSVFEIAVNRGSGFFIWSNSQINRQPRTTSTIVVRYRLKHAQSQTLKFQVEHKEERGALADFSENRWKHFTNDCQHTLTNIVTVTEADIGRMITLSATVEQPCIINLQGNVKMVPDWNDAEYVNYSYGDQRYEAIYQNVGHLIPLVAIG